jgi:hypothetical protein
MRERKMSGTAVAEPQPYKQFMEALEELDLVISLHGTGSTEADMARSHVRRLREAAAEAWRSRAA